MTAGGHVLIGAGQKMRRIDGYGVAGADGEIHPHAVMRLGEVYTVTEIDRIRGEVRFAETGDETFNLESFVPTWGDES